MNFDTTAFGSLFEMSRDAVIGISDGVVQFANPAAESLLELHAGDRADTKLPAEIITDPSERFAASCEVNGVSLDMTIVRRGSFTLMQASRREPPPMFAAPIDRALAEFGVDLASLRHAADAILSEDAAPDRREDKAALLYKSLYRLRRLHRHLVLAERILRGELDCFKRPVDLRSLCASLCQSIAQTILPMGYAVRFEAEQPCKAMADAELIETMLLNLITNSLLYSNPDREILVTLSVHGERCVIAVNDHGSGMDAQSLSAAIGHEIREPPLSDTKAGLGLGLYIARGIAEAHGGTLIMESRENTGTGVRVSLPCLDMQGIEFFASPDNRTRLQGMHPILTELSVFLDRHIFRDNLFD